MADSRVHPFPGFNPDDVLAESDGSPTPPAHDDDEGAAPPPTTKPAGGLPKLLLIGAGAVIALGTVYMSIRPMLGHSAAPAAAPGMGKNQVAAQSLPMTNPAAAPMPATMQPAATAPQTPMEATASPTLPTQAPAPAAAPQPDNTLATATVHAPADPLIGGTPAAQSEAAAAPAVASSQIAGLQSQLGELQGSVATLTKTVNALQAQAAGKAGTAPVRREAVPVSPPSGMTAQHFKRHRTEGERRDVAKASPAAPASHAAHAPVLASGGPSLKAVVTGRAWFQSASGATLTVSPGDTVPVYGRVVSIDASAGEVHFANGEVVR